MRKDGVSQGVRPAEGGDGHLTVGSFVLLFDLYGLLRTLYVPDTNLVLLRLEEFPFV